MPRLMVPRSWRRMKGTVTPLSVVVKATSSAGAAGSYGLKQALAPVMPEQFDGAVVLLYQKWNSVAMLHCASVAKVVKPLGFLCGMLPLPGCGVGVAQTQGWI